MCKQLWPEIYQGLVPGYKVGGVEFYFKENLVRVRRLDHARIHWGYKCDDLEPLFEYITPKQWIIDLIPRGDNRDIGAAVLIAKGEIDGIDMSGENHPKYKHGRAVGFRDNPEIRVSYDKEYNQTPERKAIEKKRYQTPEYKEQHNACMKALNATPEYKAYKKEYMKKYNAERYARKKAETQSKGTLEPFLK